MFLVCEPIAWGLEHVPFNAAFLQTIRYAFPEESITFCGERTHLYEVKREVGEEIADFINWVDLVLSSRHSSFYRRFISDLKTVKCMLNKLKSNHSNDVLVLTGNPSLLWCLKYLTHTKHSDKRIQVILHGDFSKLRYRPSLKKMLNPFYQISSLKFALRTPGHRRIQYIVLEESVRDVIIEYIPSLKQNVMVLDHPVLSNEHALKCVDMQLPLRIGFLGRTSEHKGFSTYLAVANEISRRYPNEVNFYLIGRVVENYDTSEMNCLTNRPGRDDLSREKYNRLVKDLHFVCLFHDKYYEFCASGVLMDSIEWEKPVIANRLPIFENLAHKFGDIGYICDRKEFINVISSIIEKIDNNRYRQQVANIQEIKKTRIPEMLSKKYLELVQNL